MRSEALPPPISGRKSRKFRKLTDVTSESVIYCSDGVRLIRRYLVNLETGERRAYYAEPDRTLDVTALAVALGREPTDAEVRRLMLWYQLTALSPEPLQNDINQSGE